MTGHRLFWPLACSCSCCCQPRVYRPGFFRSRCATGHLYGSLIDILRLSAPLILVALGMTLVIATGGIDLSVGSVVAISGASPACTSASSADQNSVRRAW